MPRESILLHGVQLPVAQPAPTADEQRYRGATQDWKEVADRTPVGAMVAFAASSAPAGWLLCDGSVVSRTTYADLFGLVGTTWGAGEGSTTFNHLCPCLRLLIYRSTEHGTAERQQSYEQCRLGCHRPLLFPGGVQGDSVLGMLQGCSSGASIESASLSAVRG